MRRDTLIRSDDRGTLKRTQQKIPSEGSRHRCADSQQGGEAPRGQQRPPLGPKWQGKGPCCHSPGGAGVTEEGTPDRNWSYNGIQPLPGQSTKAGGNEERECLTLFSSRPLHPDQASTDYWQNPKEAWSQGDQVPTGWAHEGAQGMDRMLELRQPRYWVASHMKTKVTNNGDGSSHRKKASELDPGASLLSMGTTDICS